MLRLRKIFPFFLLSVLFGTSLIVHSAGGEVVPSWFNKGVFVEIRLEHFPVIRYLGSGGYGGKPSKEFCGFLRWEVLDFDGETAKMSIALYRGPIKALVTQAEFYVDVSTRDVTLLNGTGVGKTNLWVPANLKKDDIIPFIGKEPNVVFGKVREGGGPRRTCQGYQLSFWIETINQIIDHRVVGPYGAGLFDEDTGIRDDGILEYEGAFAAMNIEGLHGFGTWEIGDTNVDLGPRFLTSEILSFFFVDYPFTLPVVVFVSIFLVLLWRRRKKNIQQLKHYRRGL